MTNNGFNGWSLLTHFSDIISIISFILTIITLCLTSGIKKAVLLNEIKRSYRNEIADRKKTLNTMLDQLKNGKILDKLLTGLTYEVNYIKISYEALLTTQQVKTIDRFIQDADAIDRKSEVNPQSLTNDDIKHLSRELQEVLAFLDRLEKTI